MKNLKKLVIMALAIMAIAVPLTAYGATTDTSVGQAIRGFCGVDTTKLTDVQKADMLSSWKQMMEVKKEGINKMVANGTITKEVGAATIKQIDDLIKYREANGFATGSGAGRMNGGRRGNANANGTGTGAGNGTRGNGGGMMTGGCGACTTSGN